MASESPTHAVIDGTTEPPVKVKCYSIPSSASDMKYGGPSEVNDFDFTIICDEEKLAVHKAVLSRHSLFFRTFLEGPTCMKETQTNEMSLQALSRLTIKDIINFMYTDEINISLTSLDSLINAGSFLQMDHLVEKCTKWMCEKFTVGRYRSFMNTAQHYSLTTAAVTLNHLAAQQFLSLVEDQKLFLGLEKEELAAIVAHDCIRVNSERRLMSYIELWLAKRVRRTTPCNSTLTGEQEDTAGELLSKVRYCLMNRRELLLLSDVSHYPQSINTLIQSALSYHADFQSDKPLISTVQNRIRSDKASIVLVLDNGINERHEILACDGEHSEIFSLYSYAAFRNTCGVVTVDNRLYIVSVEDGLFDLNSAITLTCYDPCIRDERPLPSPCTQAKFIPSCIAVVGRMIYLCGGFSMNQDSVVNTCEAFNVDTVQWEMVPSLPNACNKSAAVELDGTLYLSGGFTESAISDQLVAYKPGESHWVTLASMNVARRGHAMLAVDGGLLACGGLTIRTRPRQNLIPIERYSCDTNSWTLVASCSTIQGPSLGHFIVLPRLPSKLYMLGHEFHDSRENEIWSLDIENGTPRSSDRKRRFVLPERCKLNHAHATYLYLNFLDDNVKNKRVLGEGQ